MLEFTRNGRKVSQRQFFDGIKKDVINKAEDAIEKRLRALRDPKTGRPLKVTKERRNGEAFWNVQGSPAAIEEAKRIVGGT